MSRLSHRFSARPWSRGGGGARRRTVVEIPDDAPTTDAIFLVLRRLRSPLVILILIVTVSVGGLTLIPGLDPDGNPARLTAFDAFYFMSYTATTIGFGELPYPFTAGQRMWVTTSIYASVIGWAYAIGTLFALMQEPGFREAIATERFRRKVQRLDEPFLVIAGYGHAGRLLSRGLNALDRPFVAIDGDRSRIELLTADQLAVDPPGMWGNLRNPALLGLAGLGHRRCAGVLAMSGDDDVNLSIAMTVNLLRPEVPVIARCSDRVTEEHMHDFGTQAVINPYDRFGGYLLVGLRRPVTYQLVSWLMSARGSALPRLREGLADGRWVVCVESSFGSELVADLRGAGLDVVEADPAAGDPDVTDAVGFVAGTNLDTVNLSMAVHARIANPDVFLVVRQQAYSSAPLVEALDFDSVFMPTELVAREALARVLTPVFWTFLDYALTQDDAWSKEVMDRLVGYSGERTPQITPIVLVPESAPAVCRWLGSGQRFRAGDLITHPSDHHEKLPLVPLVVVRADRYEYMPATDYELSVGDVVLLAGRPGGFEWLSETLYYDTTAEYVATGRTVPSTWAGRLVQRRGRSARRHP